MLQFHSREFDLALQGNTEHPELMAILVDDTVKVLANAADLNAELIMFLTRFYDRELKKINTASNISFEQKAFYIRKYRGKIAQLKRGVLVGFEA